MAPDNFDAMMQQLLHRRPFQMFTVQLMTGEQFQVDHPDAVAFKAGAAVFIGPGKRFYWFDNNSVSHFIDQSAETTA